MSIPTNLTPSEEGHATISGSFGNIGIPTTATYSLNDEKGTIMNNLDDVEIPGFTNSYTIELDGKDLEIPVSALTRRFLLIVITYGAGKTTNEELEFTIKNQVGIKNP